MNAITVLHPYKHEGMWVFDDPDVGLRREPFVSGIDTMIDNLVADIPNAASGFNLLFSPTPFPGHTVKLEWRRAESGGNWYYSEQFQMEGERVSPERVSPRIVTFAKEFLIVSTLLPPTH